MISPFGKQPAGAPKMPGVTNPMYSKAPQQQGPDPIRPQYIQPNGTRSHQAPQQQPQTSMPVLKAQPPKQQANPWRQPAGGKQYSVPPQQNTSGAPWSQATAVGNGQWKGPDGNPVWVESFPGERNRAAENQQKDAAHQAWLASRGDGKTPTDRIRAMQPMLSNGQAPPAGGEKSREQQIFERRLATTQASAGQNDRMARRDARLARTKAEFAPKPQANPSENLDWMKANMGWAPGSEAEAQRYRSGYQKQADQAKAMREGDYSGASNQPGFYQVKPGFRQYMPEGLSGHVQQQKLKQQQNPFASLIQSLGLR